MTDNRFGKLGGGSPFAKIAVLSAEPSAEKDRFVGKNAKEIGEIEALFCRLPMS